MENLRPTFLTVLCILTFIGSGFGIYSAISNYTQAGMTSELTKDAMEQSRDQIEESADEKSAEIVNKMLDSVESNLTEDKVRDGAIASGIANILTLVGAVLMWGLNKKGFYLYLIGALVSVIAALFIYDGILSAIASAGIGFFSIIFCVLYFVNLKHLR